MVAPHPSGPPMTLGNVRELGAQHLIAFCLNDACHHQALIDVSSYPAETEVPCRVKCGKCGGRSNKIDVRPNWREQPGMPTKVGLSLMPWPVPKELPES